MHGNVLDLEEAAVCKKNWAKMNTQPNVTCLQYKDAYMTSTGCFLFNQWNAIFNVTMVIGH